jgi:hypothetical protein
MWFELFVLSAISASGIPGAIIRWGYHSNRQVLKRLSSSFGSTAAHAAMVIAKIIVVAHNPTCCCNLLYDNPFGSGKK